jgi:hypothetical protein
MKPGISASGSRAAGLRRRVARAGLQDGEDAVDHLWESQESMEALRGRTPPGGSLGIVTDRREIFDVVEEY